MEAFYAEEAVARKVAMEGGWTVFYERWMVTLDILLLLVKQEPTHISNPRILGDYVAIN